MLRKIDILEENQMTKHSFSTLFLDKCIERFPKEILKECHILYEKKHIINRKRDKQIASIMQTILGWSKFSKRRETFMWNIGEFQKNECLWKVIWYFNLLTSYFVLYSFESTSSTPETNPIAAQTPVYLYISNRLVGFFVGGGEFCSFVLFVTLFLGLLKTLKESLLENNLIFRSG